IRFASSTSSFNSLSMARKETANERGARKEFREEKAGFLRYDGYSLQSSDLMWRKTQKTLATFVPAMLLLVYLTVAICLLNRWDAMVPVTLIPVWAWAGFGMLLSLLCGIFCRGLPSLLMFCLCLATAVLFSEETIGLA